MFKKLCSFSYLSLYLFSLLMLIAVNSTNASPHDREEHLFRQPDNTLVPVVVSGDEYYQDVETPDGYSLIRDPKDSWICYAMLSDDADKFISTGLRYLPQQGLSKSRATQLPEKHLRINKKVIKELRTQSYLELHGTSESSNFSTVQKSGLSKALASPVDTIYGVTILVDFKDVKSSIPRDSIINFLNQTGYRAYSNNGSVKDYFQSISGGKLIYLQKVTSFVTAKNNMSYYDRTDGSGYAGSYELVTEILTTLRNEGTFDFSQATISNGIVRAVNILYAGSPSAGWNQGLWAHSATTNFKINNVTIRKRMLASIGTKITIGSFCHENGHSLCNWPDLYTYDDHSNGAGRYDVMASTGAGNPAPPNPFFRESMGWMEIINISTGALGKIFKVPANTNFAYFYSNGSSAQESYYIEARRRTGRSASLPDSGLIIWHVNKAGDNTEEGKNDHVMPEQADGKFDLEKKINTGDGNDLFCTPASKAFNDNTSPSAKWHNGTNSNIQIANISAVKDTMTFSFGQITTVAGSLVTPKGKSTFSYDPVHAALRYTTTASTSGYPVKVSIVICDLRGQIVKTIDDSYKPSNSTFTVKIGKNGTESSKCSSGKYICYLKIDNERHAFSIEY